jgi:acyl-CoA thioesterase I
MRYLLVIVLLLAACTQTPTEQTVQETVQQVQQEITTTIPEEIPILPPEPTVIVAFGDSLTEGTGVSEEEAYPAQLEEMLKVDGYDVIVYNEGVSGELSGGAVQRIDTVLAHDPDIVILETGVNDILQGVPFEQTSTNINTIIDELQASNVTVILAGMEAYGSYQGYSIQIQTMYPRIAEEQNVPFIPFFLAGVAGVPELNLPDYVHPNAAGYRIIAEQNVKPIVEKEIEKN